MLKFSFIEQSYHTEWLKVEVYPILTQQKFIPSSYNVCEAFGGAWIILERFQFLTSTVAYLLVISWKQPVEEYWRGGLNHHVLAHREPLVQAVVQGGDQGLQPWYLREEFRMGIIRMPNTLKSYGHEPWTLFDTPDNNFSIINW